MWPAKEGEKGDTWGDRHRDRASHREKARITGKLARKGGGGGREGESEGGEEGESEEGGREARRDGGRRGGMEGGRRGGGERGY